MDKVDLLAYALEKIMSKLQDKEYLTLTIDDIAYDVEINRAFDKLYSEFKQEEIIQSDEGHFTIDHLSSGNEHYYIIFDSGDEGNDIIIILKDNSREFEKLVYKYQDELIEGIKRCLGLNSKFLLSDDNDGVSLYFPESITYQDVEDAETKECKIPFHGTNITVKYNIKEIDGKKYAYVLIDHNEYNQIFSLWLTGENYKERLF